MNDKLKRNCPGCGREIPYKNVSYYNLANRRNSHCLSCRTKQKYDILHSPEVRKKKSISMMGKNVGEKNGMKRLENRRKVSEKLRDGRINGEKNSFYNKLHTKEVIDYLKEINTGIKNPNYGLKRTEETKRKIRLKTIERLKKNKFNGGDVFVNYSPEACKIIDEYGKQHDYDFQHAENGGEKCIDGYFPDGIDEQKKTIIEVDEPHHYNAKGNLKQKDIERQKYFENVGYKVIRIRVNKNHKITEIIK